MRSPQRPMKVKGLGTRLAHYQMGVFLRYLRGNFTTLEVELEKYERTTIIGPQNARELP